MDKEKIEQVLPRIKKLYQEPLSHFTFTQTGGPADCLLFPKTSAEVKDIILFCQKENIPWTVLGNASNLIVRDGGMSGFVVMLEEMDQVQVSGSTITASAGAKLIDTTLVAKEAHLTGLEFACGIPGSIGGAVYMNAGAYGGEVKDVIQSVEIVWEDGRFETLTNKEMNFSYRHSVLQEKKGVVLSVTFALEQGDHSAISSRMAELTELRESKQPLEYPSCGSVFKRPEGHYTGKLIQDAGLQGLKWGGAQISEKHAGFIVNINQATATDYIELIQHIQAVIFQQFGVRLETEVRIIGREK